MSINHYFKYSLVSFDFDQNEFFPTPEPLESTGKEVADTATITIAKPRQSQPQLAKQFNAAHLVGSSNGKPRSRSV
jgi:hypothetical protein